MTKIWRWRWEGPRGSWCRLSICHLTVPCSVKQGSCDDMMSTHYLFAEFQIFSLITLGREGGYHNMWRLIGIMSFLKDGAEVIIRWFNAMFCIHTDDIFSSITPLE